MKVSVIGLGKLGSCTAACFASKGYKIIGIDTNVDIIDKINKKQAPFLEPQLQEYLNKYGDNLLATDDYSMAIKETNISFLILPTPSKPTGDFSDAHLKDALINLSKHFAKKDREHIFVIVSTVSPGTIENSLIPIIEKYSGKKLNKDFGVIYNPEFIALGSIIKDFLNPDLVLIGESSREYGDIVEDIYKKVVDNNPYFARMSIISAEITKIGLNAFVTMKISFANTLGNICEKIPEAEINKITKALGADKRISPYYLKAGPPYGGPCFPRDNRAFTAFAKKYGIDAKLAKATDEINNFQIIRISEMILSNLPKNKKVAIVGLAYKDRTPVIEESAAIKVIENLKNQNIKFLCFDELANENVKDYFVDNPNVEVTSALEECITNADLIILFTQDKNIINKICRMPHKKVFKIWED